MSSDIQRNAPLLQENRWGVGEAVIRPCLLARTKAVQPHRGRFRTLPVVGEESPGRQVFECPSVLSPRKGGGTCLDLQFLEASNGPTTLRCELPSGFPAPDPGQRTMDARVTRFLIRCGQHIDFVHGAIEGTQADSFHQGHAHQSRCRVSALRRLWANQAEGETARYSLIVRIAEVASDLVEGLANRPRRILRRERKMEEVNSVREMDAACIRWLARQPGRSLVQQLAGRGIVLAVKRAEISDTLENRVLKDFLVRCGRAADEYVYSNSGQPKADRVRLVRRYGDACGRLLTLDSMAGVAAISGTVAPNYVLQFDPRYRKLWYWYNRLRKREEEEDEIWMWRQRTWSEMLLLQTVQCLDDLERRALHSAVAIDSEVAFRREHQCGCFIDPRTAIGPFVFGTSTSPVLVELGVLSDVRLTPYAADSIGELLRLAPDAVFRVTVGKGAQGSHLIPVWIELPDPNTGCPLADQVNGLSERIQSLRSPPLVFAIIRGDWNATVENDAVCSTYGHGGVSFTTCPNADPKSLMSKLLSHVFTVLKVGTA